MRNLTTKHRLQGLSVRELVREFDVAATEVGTEKDFLGRKLKPGPLLNALVLHFLSLDKESRLRFGNVWVARLELYLSETDEERAAALAHLAKVEGNGAETTAGGKGRVASDSAAVKIKRRDRTEG